MCYGCKIIRTTTLRYNGNPFKNTRVVKSPWLQISKLIRIKMYPSKFDTPIIIESNYFDFERKLETLSYEATGSIKPLHVLTFSAWAQNNEVLCMRIGIVVFTSLTLFCFCKYFEHDFYV